VREPSCWCTQQLERAGTLGEAVGWVPLKSTLVPEKKCEVSRVRALGVERNKRFCVRGDKLCRECSQSNACKPGIAQCSLTWHPLPAKLQAKARSGGKTLWMSQSIGCFFNAGGRCGFLCVSRGFLCCVGTSRLVSFYCCLGYTERNSLIHPSASRTGSTFLNRMWLMSVSPAVHLSFLLALLLKIFFKKSESAVLVSDYLPFSICSKVLT